jgi:hypothetical protein
VYYAAHSFCQGDRAETGRSRMPMAGMRRMKAAPYAPSCRKLDLRCYRMRATQRNIIKRNATKLPAYALQVATAALLEGWLRQAPSRGEKRP